MELAAKASSPKRRRRDPRLPVLYLDYDGVLHPDEVYRVGNQVVLRMDGFALFEWSSIIESLIAPYPELQIVLSTSWVPVFGFDNALVRLPDALQRRVVGATWHLHDPGRWRYLTRFEQILGDVQQHRHHRWLAVDDDGIGWPDEARANLVLTDSLLGLGVVSAQQELAEKLEALHR
ncbi:HAD domain-containing protein [Azoarcus sp. KH32C]|uniref:HAD domain-containing protein n=1 Tax=Azoarcus sp. KH32C TaxID=748247 RepID=UPI0002385FCD|nr:HAD domain-containing protein [Azoarcus sp. KH32C]BAL23496.1 hypothetical protein AZKH_1167 [Azoarcus sp. KH32C]